jgi:hypothetical protein
MLRKYANEIVDVLYGNSQADRLADLGRQQRLPQLPPLSRFMPNFVLRVSDVPGVEPRYCVDNMLRTVTTFAYGALVKKFLKKYPEKFSLFETLHTQYDTATSFIFKTTALRLSSLQDFALKIASSKLPLRSRLFSDFQSERNESNPNMAKIRRLAVKYDTPSCPFGCLCNETWSHLVSCPHNCSAWQTVPNDVVKLINKYAKPPVLTAPVWYVRRSNFINPPALCSPSPELRQLLSFPVTDGSAGFLPLALRDWLTKNGVPRAVLSKCLSELQILILHASHEVWLRRCHKLYGAIV